MNLLYSSIDLRACFNTAGTTRDTDRSCGAVNAWGNSFPAEEFPFGTNLTVNTVPFHLPHRHGAYDHIEAMGQSISLPEPVSVCGLGLLCFGEMGNQELDVYLSGETSISRHLIFEGKTWLVEAQSPQPDDGLIFSHLHYPGDYELALLRPALWCCRICWQQPVLIRTMLLGVNPLFHLFAATFLHQACDE